jgi:uncharacterized RDD family membrane protein YckC
VTPKPTQVVGRRVGGYLLDSFVFSIAGTIAWFALTHRFNAKTSTGGGFVIGDTRYAFDSSTNRTVWLVILVLVWLLIFVVLPGLRGTSPGRAATGIRLVGAKGEPPGVGRALLRQIAWIVDGFPYFIWGIVAFVTALSSRANQRVGDMAAGTYVVRSEVAGRPIAELLPEAGAAQVAPGAWQAPAQALQTGAAVQAGPAATHPAGWYSDPQGEARLRWWDGSAWTSHTSA